MKRPGFQKMLTAIEAGYISAVFVKDLSRLGRNYIEVGKLTEEFFPLHDIRLVAVSDGVDSDEGEDDFTVELTSARINVKHVEHFLYNHHTGYIRISMFSGNCAEEFREAVKDLTDRNMTSLVIDLRNNPGGLLKDVVSVADTLLGECTIVTVRDGKGGEETYTSNKKGVSVPVAIIVNENSASASEILAAAVQDNEAGVVVGMTTFGKGVVQSSLEFADGSGMKVTTARYYTPSGECIHEIGIEPDVEVELDEDAVTRYGINNLPHDHDAQLQKAIELLGGTPVLTTATPDEADAAEEK